MIELSLVIAMLCQVHPTTGSVSPIQVQKMQMQCFARLHECVDKISGNGVTSHHLYQCVKLEVK